MATPIKAMYPRDTINKHSVRSGKQTINRRQVHTRLCTCAIAFDQELEVVVVTTSAQRIRIEFIIPKKEKMKEKKAREE